MHFASDLCERHLVKLGPFNNFSYFCEVRIKLSVFLICNSVFPNYSFKTQRDRVSFLV